MNGKIVFYKWAVDSECVNYYQDICDCAAYHGLNIVLEGIETFKGDQDSIYANTNFLINKTRDFAIASIAKVKNIKCFNNSFTSLVANSKMATYEHMIGLDIPVMATKYLNEINFEQIQYPKIIKHDAGHGGKEVYFIKNANDLDLFLDEHENYDPYIIQDIASNLGVDVRVYALGDRIISSIKRTNQNDFRSNISIGGKAELFSVDNILMGYCKKILKFLNSDFIGIDFVINNGNWILNEIEDPVGCRELCRLSTEDIVDKYICYIKDYLEI